MLTLFELGLVHFVADWRLQNDGMARSKGSVRHPVARVHAGVDAAALGLALGSWQAGMVLGLLHNAALAIWIAVIA